MNGDGGCGRQYAVYNRQTEVTAEVGWRGLRVGGHLALSCRATLFTVAATNQAWQHDLLLSGSQPRRTGSSDITSITTITRFRLTELQMRDGMR